MKYIIYLFLISTFFSLPVANAYDCTPASDFTMNVTTLHYQGSNDDGNYEKLGDINRGEYKKVMTCSNTSGIYSQSVVFAAVGYAVGADSVAPDGSILLLANGSQNKSVVYSIGVDAPNCGQWGFVKPWSQYTMTVCPTTANGVMVSPKIQFWRDVRWPVDSMVTTISRTYAGEFLIKINGSVVYKVPVYFNSFNVQSIPCKVTTKSISVPLGDISRGRFSGMSSTAGGTNFNISLQCTRSTPVTLQIDPTGTSPNRMLGLIPITPGAGSASGVAIQLINNQTGKSFNIGSPVSLNRPSIGAYNISLKAQYMQVADQIKSGQAKGSATFTVRYQ